MLGTKTREELLEFREGRRYVIGALTRMAVWKELFRPAASLLLALAEAETESWANNSTGVFVDLFSTGTGQLAPTEAPFSERLPILRELLSSDSPDRRKLGIQACTRALSAGPFHRAIGAEWQGIRREPDLWVPSTYGELFDAYRSVWGTVRHALDHLDGEERVNAVDALTSNARGLTRIESLVDMIIETIRELAGDSKVDHRELIDLTASIFHYDVARLESETRRKWEQLEEDLSGDDFSSQMVRYVAMDLLVDYFDEEGNHVDQVQPQIKKLASMALEAPALLNAEMHWLVTKRAKSGYKFGYELGERDLSCKFLDAILDAQAVAGDDSDLSFAGAYLRALAERAPEDWESLLDFLFQDPARAPWVVELTWRSGKLTERGARRVLGLTRAGVIAPAELRMFRYGAVVRSLSPLDLGRWMEVLLGSDRLDAVSAALDLSFAYYMDSGTPLPKEPVFNILRHPAWFTPNNGIPGPSHDTFEWAEMAKLLCRDHLDVAVELADLILTHMGERGTIVERFGAEPLQVLDAVTHQHPGQVWQLASSMLGPPVDSRAFHIANWLRGSEASGQGGTRILESVPYDLIWQWADEDLAFRPSYLATFVPKVLCGPRDDPCLARELLLRYGDNPDVRNSLRSNFSTEVWWGPRSQHLVVNQSWLLNLRSQETHPRVLMWIDEYCGEIEHEVELARGDEERRGL